MIEISRTQFIYPQLVPHIGATPVSEIIRASIHPRLLFTFQDVLVSRQNSCIYAITRSLGPKLTRVHSHTLNWGEIGLVLLNSRSSTPTFYPSIY